MNLIDKLTSSPTTAHHQHSPHHLHTTINLHKKSNYKPIGFNALAKAASRYGFVNVFSGFFCVDENGNVMKMKMPGDKEGMVHVPMEDIALDLEYGAQAHVGTPGVKLNLDLDTGSSDMICWSSPARFDDDSKTRDRVLYDPQASETATLQKGNSSKEARFSTLTPIPILVAHTLLSKDETHASGDVHSDFVRLGDCEVSKMCIQVTQKVSNSFVQGVKSDGILGLGFSSGNSVKPEHVKTWFAHAIDYLEKPIFSVNMKHGHPGSYTFGKVDETITSNKIHYTSVETKGGHWKIDTPYWRLDGSNKDTSGKQAILDTGIALILLNDIQTTEFYQSLEGAKIDANMGGWTFPITCVLPEVALAVGNNLITLAPETLRFGEPNAEGYVFGAIQSCGDLGFNVFGEAFLKNCYVVFDQEKCEVGVAQKSPC